jgi:hypothetical protein
MTDIPDEVMIDANVHSYIKEDPDLRTALGEAPIRVRMCAIQDSEVWDGIERPVDDETDVKDYVILTVTFEEEVKPDISGVDTSQYGETYGWNYAGGTGEIYEDLMRPDESLRDIQRPDAQGAEAAINRDTPFVTADGPLKERMREYGYGEYLIPWDDFREYLQSYQ